ncbi:MAG: ATP-binding protein [Cytophagales bacterium]
MVINSQIPRFLSFFLIFIFFLGFTTIAQEKLSPSQIEEYTAKASSLEGNGQRNDAVYYYNKIAYHYWVSNKHEQAIDFFQKSLSISNEIGNVNGVAGIYSQIGSIYTDMQDYKKSAENFSKALEYRKKLKQKRAIVDAIFNYSESLSNLEKYSEALKVLEEARGICLEINDISLNRDCFGRLAEVAGKSGNSEDQAKYFELFQNLERQLQQEKMSAVKAESEQKIGEIKQEANTIISKKDIALKLTSQELENQRQVSKERQMAISLLEREHQIDQLTLKEQEAKLKLQQVITFSLAGGLVLVVLLAFTLYRGYVQKRKSNEQLSKLNSEITRQTNEIATQNHQLEKNNFELTELNVEKNYIIGIVAHDLKSPLNNLKGLLDIFRMRIVQPTEEQTKYMDLMSKSIERMKSMISRILDVNAVEQKDLNINMKEVDLAELIKNLVSDKLESAANKKIHIRTEFSDKKYLAKVDDEFYYQVMENLITNAIKFSPFDKNIYLKLNDDNGKVRTEVKDEGPGINDEERSKLFKKFSKLSARPTNGESSTGLGLSIVKRYVEAMNGHVWCESTVGKGTSFIVEFEKPATA